MGNSYTTDMNSTYDSISTNEKGDRRWSSFEYYPFQRGKKRDVYEGISFKSSVEKSNGAYWTKRKCVVKSIKPDDFDLNDVSNENSYWFRELCKTGKVHAKSFADELQSYNTSSLSKIIFVNSYLAKVNNISCLWNNVCNMFSQKQRISNKRKYVLIEDQINGKFETMINRNGVQCNTNYRTEVLEGFIHFTYHQSEGKLIKCGFQGARDCYGNYYLTFPTIHSVDQSFGPKDRGNEGIQKVFNNHSCGEYCQKEWIKP